MTPTAADANRADALARLEAFVPAAGRAYAARRNADPGPEAPGYVSRLSPYLRHRLLTETEVAGAAIARHGFDGAEKFVQEVFWRTYFKGWLEQHPRVWRDYREGVRRARARLAATPAAAAARERACTGQTGIDGFDAWANELTATGYLHNHARMWFASIWVFTLKLPWELGAEFFLTHLIDGDPASNTLSWRWVSGLHTRGKTYLARADNIAKFTEGRFRPTGQLAASAPALEETDPAPREALATPAPAQLGASDVLLLTDDDLHFESLPGALPARVALVDLSAARTDVGVAPHVAGFVAAALDDRAEALVRATDSAPERFVATDAASLPALAEALAADIAANAGDAERVFTPYAPVGPGADFLLELERALAALPGPKRPALVRYLRDLDRLAWPHADRGYFKLKKRLPELVAALGIS